MVVPVHGESAAELFLVRATFYRMGGRAGVVQRRQQHRGQNGDDGDHNQKFNQGKQMLHGRFLPCMDHNVFPANLMSSFLALAMWAASRLQASFPFPASIASMISSCSSQMLRLCGIVCPARMKREALNTVESNR
ncbi:hypothetical protein SDC9_190906 [bioreactor metagenome]|uniref:Uncharacterized protein n=1 Tax=bioreactor metagenome TaxID=1076179 RepID=A0A645HWH3_9ZZZZ